MILITGLLGATIAFSHTKPACNLPVWQIYGVVQQPFESQQSVDQALPPLLCLLDQASEGITEGEESQHVTLCVEDVEEKLD